MRTHPQIGQPGREEKAIGDTQFVRPTKEEVRAWLLRVIASGKPPPSAAAIQQELWHMHTANGEKERS